MDLALTMLAVSLEAPLWALEIASVAWVIVVTVFVVLERRRPTATLALLLALVFLPIVGLLAYLLFSRSRLWRRRRMRERREVHPVDDTHRVASLDELPSDLPPAQAGLVRLGLRSAAAPLRHADAVTLLPTAAEAFAAFEAAIRGAQRFIHCQFYIWLDDKIGRRITAMLTERARAGVRVRVLYDHVGSLRLPPSHFDALREAGGEVAIFGRLRVPSFRLGRGRLNFRNHRKIMTVDGDVGLLGGLNVGDVYLDPEGDDSRWRDLQVRINGDAVLGLDAIFLEDWLHTTGEVVDLEGERPLAHNSPGPAPKRPRRWRGGGRATAGVSASEGPFADVANRPIESVGPLLQIIPSGPDRENVSVIGAQMTAAIAVATRRAWIATPYLVPDEPLLLVLRTAALRGVDVRMLVPTPEHNDSPLVALASRSYYEELLETGCRIFEYHRGMLHAKYLVLDDVCAVGSANMDIRSFYLNYEVTAMFYDSHVTGRLAEIFDGDLASAHEVELAEIRDPTFVRRLLESFARVLSPLL
jgi:cardiolipin synthase